MYLELYTSSVSSSSSASLRCAFSMSLNRQLFLGHTSTRPGHGVDTLEAEQLDEEVDPSCER